MDVKLVECGKIDVPKISNDLRTFSKEFATNLADTIKAEGLFNPIAVRPSPVAEGRFLLVQGKHRLYATKNVLKEQFIRATVIADMDDEEAEMAMIAENLWRNPLTRPQHLLCVKKWWDHYQAKYPEKAVLGAAGRAAAAKAREVKKAAQAADANGQDATVSSSEGGTQDEAAETGFNDQVAAATGQSQRSAARTVKLAKTFDADQLEAFGHMETSQADMLTIAKIKDKTQRDEVVNLVASGMVAEEAIKEVMKDAAPARETGLSKAEAEAKKSAKEEKAPELGDEEWFKLYCGEKAAMLGDTARFKADALFFRKTADHRHLFRTKVKSALKATAEAGTTGSYYSLVKRLISIGHPKNWLLCDQCNGTGQVDGEKCKRCWGGGYLLKTEEIL